MYRPNQFFSGPVYFTLVLTLTLLLIFSARAKNVQANIEEKVKIGGTIEAEISSTSRKYDDPNRGKEKENDILLSTLELKVNADLNPSVHGQVTLLWEEENDEKNLDEFVDEGTITLGDPDKCPYYLTVGKMYLPFGQFDSAFITDPLTLEIGEINQTAFQIGYYKGTAEFSFGFFNGDLDKTGKDNTINNFFINMGMNYTDGPYGLTIGVSYLSNMFDVDNIEGMFDPNAKQNYRIDGYPQGIGAFLRADTESTFLIVEYVSALNDFKSKSTLFSSTLRPQAYNFEFGWRSPKEVELALKLEISDDMETPYNECAFTFPSQRYGLVLSYPIFDKATLGLEYIHEKYKWVEKGKNDCLTAQLAISF